MVHPQKIPLLNAVYESSGNVKIIAKLNCHRFQHKKHAIVIIILQIRVRIHRQCGVGNFAERCDFKIEKFISNFNCQQQVLIVFTPV
jgi:hypothetical protein